MKKILDILSSAKITVVCIFLLFVLTFWGTVAQVQHGLYAAQERYFFSFFFLVFGFFPFPGAQMVLWVMFVNLMASAVTQFSKMKDWRYIGLKISHFGILIYFVAAFVTLHLSKEGFVRLAEGASTNVGTSYTDWEIALWKEGKSLEHDVTAYTVNHAKAGDVIDLGEFRVTVEQNYPNCSAFSGTVNKEGYINGSGITMLEPKGLDKDREKNIAGGAFKVQGPDGKTTPMFLFGNESKPTIIKVGGQDHAFILRLSRYPLPITIKLKKFKAEFYPGTNQAKNYESVVEVIKPGVVRDVRIFMNNPLRDKDFTFYQASYDTDDSGRQHSTLAVVQNAGQILPYIACFVVFIGLALHFTIAALMKKRI